MSATLEDYQSALDAYVEDIRSLGDDLVSVLLYGSMARGKIRPGVSDMDAYVVLGNEVFDERKRFLHALDVLVEAGGRLSRSRVPFHPFHYFSLDELSRIRAEFVPHWQAENRSRVILGPDVRSRIKSTAASRFGTRAIFFEARRVLVSLVQYLDKPTLSIQECQRIIGHLCPMRRHLPKMACVALDLWPDIVVAEQEFARVFPEVDTSVLKRIDALRELTEDEINTEQIRAVLKEALTFLDSVNSQLLAKLQAKREASNAPNQIALLLG